MMIKKLFLCLFLVSIAFFGLCVFKSSPYRELRPYFLFQLLKTDKNKSAKLGSNNKTVIRIGSDDAFYIDQRPVTIKEYRTSTAPDSPKTQHYRNNYTKYFDQFWYDDLPVSFVTWNEARQYCTALGGDLPTEEQWMLAADEDDSGDSYAWGNDFPSLSRANFDGYYQSQVPAGWLPKGASASGVLDLNGNVREWILNENPDNADEKSLKGAAFQDSFSDGKNEAAFYHDPTSSGFNRGFRCVYPADIFE